MKTLGVSLVALALLALALLVGGMFWQMGVKKGEIGLATRYEAQFNVVETGLFKMRAAIKNIHACNDEWADKFIQVVALQKEGRGGNRVALPDGSAGVAVAASAPTLQIGRESEALGIPQELYMKLANAIEGQLADFTRQQDILTDVWREHTAYCKDPYHNWLGLALESKVRPKPEMITSADTKAAVESKQMDEKLF
jgi:hypothetical protein